MPGCQGGQCKGSPLAVTVVSARRIVRAVGILELLDHLPEAIAQSPGRLWNVFARSLGEQGADGRTALAWRWAPTGACPAPVSLSSPLGRPPLRDELLGEAGAPAELAEPGKDPSGQVMHARLVLRWLAGELDAVPLWNGGPKNLHVTDGADYAHTPAEVEDAYFWVGVARWRYPWPDASSPAAAWRGAGWAYGIEQLLNWVCGETAEGPLTGLPIPAGRPTLYQVSLDNRRAMTAVGRAREAGQPLVAARMEAMMETFLWLAGWNPLPPIDRHGHAAFEDCAERDTPCGCDAAGRCLQGECAACWRVPCVHGFGLEDSPSARSMG